MKLTEDQKHAILADMRKGILTDQEIANKYGLKDKKYLAQLARKLGFSRRPQGRPPTKKGF